MFSVNLEAMARAQATTTPGIRYGVLLARLGQESTARFRRSLRPLNLGAQQFIVLKQLEAMGQTSQGALADALGIDYSNLAGVSAELYARGLIERTREECDRRRYAVELTSEGRRLLVDADAAVDSGEADMLSGLDDAEQAQLWELLRRVADSMELCPGSEAQVCADAEAGTESAAG
jgi:DNA-binding MarR family transcriptional regulator